MCTYVTFQSDVRASSKGVPQWTSYDKMFVYYDHPQRLHEEHALIIDLRSTRSPEQRVAVELDAQSARKLLEDVRQALEAGGA